MTSSRTICVCVMVETFGPSKGMMPKVVEIIASSLVLTVAMSIGNDREPYQLALAFVPTLDHAAVKSQCRGRPHRILLYKRRLSCEISADRGLKNFISVLGPSVDKSS